MSKQESKVFKEESHVVVYQKLLKPESIYKKYKFDGDFFETSREFKSIYRKMVAIKERAEWPCFVLKPTYVSPLYEKEFIIEYPFIDGINLGEYLKKNKIDFKTCVEFISGLEKKIMSFKDIVFPDIANPGNIMILPNEKDYVVIDPDDIQFDDYPFYGCASLLGTKPMFSTSNDFSCGIKKCLVDDRMANKQLDIRSMYALFYYVMCRQSFYPSLFDKEILDYIKDLKEYNVPNGSLLDTRTMLTLDNSSENEPISDALYELLDSGYEFETTYDDNKGYVYKLENKKKIYQ